jgi:hypothetical protein
MVHPAAGQPGTSAWGDGVDAAVAGLTRGLIIADYDVTTIPAGTTVDNLAAYYNSGTSPITVAGVELAAASAAVWAWVSGAWVLISAGTSTPPVDPGDTTPPAWTATLTTGTPTDTSVVVAASALATDDVAVTGYRWRLVGEATSVARTTTPSGLNFTLDGLTGSTTYAAPIVWAVDAGGNKSAELTAQGFTTAEPQPGFTTVFYDTFTDTDGTHLSAHTPEVGTWVTAGMSNDWQIKSNAAQYVNTTGGSWGYMIPHTTPVINDNGYARMTVVYDGGTGPDSHLAFTIDVHPTASDYWGFGVYVKRDGTIGVNGAIEATAVETTGYTTSAPLSGTAVITVDPDELTMTLEINGTLYRRWTLTQSLTANHVYYLLSGGDTYEVGQISASSTTSVRVEFMQ